MKLRVEVAGEMHWLEIYGSEYTFDKQKGSASVEQVEPGVFSILLGTKSFRVNADRLVDGYEVIGADGVSHVITISDPRDRMASADAAASKGPVMIRAQMPGKVVRILVDQGQAVEAGQGLLVVEAMKMQNEVKSPKAGTVAKILAAAESAVSAGETLLIIE